MPLITWEQARPWAKAIRDEVANRRMPPWGPVAGINTFKGDPGLSAPEIDMLIAWVEGGAPEGDSAFLPSHIPGPEPAPRLRYSRFIRFNGGMTLTAATTFVAIETAGPLDAWAEQPDGTVTRLIWIQQPSSLRARPFIFETPQTFPAGTRLNSTAPATLYLIEKNLRR